MIIMVTGKAGCGKDTFYEIASKQIKQSTIRLAFADMVKSVADMYGWDGIKDERGRKLLQSIGAVGREYNECIWIKPIVDEIKLLQRGVIPIITDLRFANEYWMINNIMQERVQVVNIVGRQSDLGENANDISEAGVTEDELCTKFITITNNGDTEKFTKDIRRALIKMGVTVFDLR